MKTVVFLEELATHTHHNQILNDTIQRQGNAISSAFYNNDKQKIHAQFPNFGYLADAVVGPINFNEAKVLF
jgi:hypothetical protein